MLWWVMNDAGNTHSTSDTEPIGLEVHVTAFAYDIVEPLVETTFYRYRLFKRGATPLEETYIGFFNDIDIGGFSDDYIGSDTTLGLGFGYNYDNYDSAIGSDGINRGYGERPPAIGLDIVRGPRVHSRPDTAWVGGVRTPGYRHLGMTSFMRHFVQLPAVDDPGPTIHQHLLGLLPDGREIREFGDGVNDVGDAPATRFMFPGDPVTRTFWSEMNPGYSGYPNAGDRRAVIASGPFSMQPGDEQEVILAVVWARGADHLDSVTELRKSDRFAQRMADLNFEGILPDIDAPQLAASPYPGAVTLTWANPPASNNLLDQFSNLYPAYDATYRFEGYNIYQFATERDTAGVRIATYDVNNGVQAVIERGWADDGSRRCRPGDPILAFVTTTP